MQKNTAAVSVLLFRYIVMLVHKFNIKSIAKLSSEMVFTIQGNWRNKNNLDQENDLQQLKYK